MTLTIEVPDRYGLVILVGAGTMFLTSWQSAVVSRHRRRAGIKYPQAYAEVEEVAKSQDALKFNCAQRAHLNTMETYPQVLFSLLVTGLKYPNWAAGLGTAYIVGRTLYTLGYVTGEPIKRNRNGGGLGAIAQTLLLISGAWTSFKFGWATLAAA